MGNADVVSMVQGYALMVTPLQLARGMCAYANGGRLVQPRLIKGTLDVEGGIISRTPQTALKMMPEVLDPFTATQMRRILADVPVRGTATKARSNMWNIFGKTGTAHISQGTAGYNETAYTSSFVGGAPYENPRLVIAVVIHEAEKTTANSVYGGAVAAPAAKEALQRSLAYLQVPASPPLTPPPPQITNLLYGYDPKLYTPRTASARD
jgi:cell division protein FtsI/penicillin-binding protein 2